MSKLSELALTIEALSLEGLTDIEIARQLNLPEQLVIDFVEELAREYQLAEQDSQFGLPMP